MFCCGAAAAHLQSAGEGGAQEPEHGLMTLVLLDVNANRQGRYVQIVVERQQRERDLREKAEREKADKAAGRSSSSGVNPSGGGGHLRTASAASLAGTTTQDAPKPSAGPSQQAQPPDGHAKWR